MADVGITGEKASTATADGPIRPYRGIARTGNQVAKEVDTEGMIADGIASGPDINEDGNLVEDTGAFTYWHGNGAILPAISGAACTLGARFMFDNQGRVIDYAAAAGKYALGKIETAATAAGQLLRVIWYGPSQ